MVASTSPRAPGWGLPHLWIVRMYIMLHLYTIRMLVYYRPHICYVHIRFTYSGRIQYQPRQRELDDALHAYMISLRYTVLRTFTGDQPGSSKAI